MGVAENRSLPSPLVVLQISILRSAAPFIRVSGSCILFMSVLICFMFRDKEGVMGIKSAYPKWLAIVGDVVMWLPIAAPILTGLPRIFKGVNPPVDYLMPAELFPAALLGMILLLWAAIARRTMRAPIGITIAAAFVGLIGCQVVAEVTGLASGAIEPTGWPWIAVLVTFGICTSSPWSCWVCSGSYWRNGWAK